MTNEEQTARALETVAAKYAPKPEAIGAAFKALQHDIRDQVDAARLYAKAWSDQ